MCILQGNSDIEINFGMSALLNLKLWACIEYSMKQFVTANIAAHNSEKLSRYL